MTRRPRGALLLLLAGVRGRLRGVRRGDRRHRYENRGNRRPFAILGAPRHGRLRPRARRAVCRPADAATPGAAGNASGGPGARRVGAVRRRCASAPMRPAAPTRSATCRRRSCSRTAASPTRCRRHEGFDWPDVPATLTPLAYTRNAVPDVLVPVYPPGLSLMMAPLTLIHANAVFLLVPLCAALTVWLTVRARARDLRAGGRSARGAARRREPDVSAAGGAADERRAGRRALALRPGPRTPAVNRCGDSRRRRLVAGHSRAAQPGAAASARRGGVRHAEAAPSDRPAGAISLANLPWTRAIWPLLAAMPGVVALGAIQAVRYGSPLGSGYGSFDDLFGLSNVAPNLARYPRWMTETHTPLIWLWLLAPLSFRFLDRGARAFGWILLQLRGRRRPCLPSLRVLQPEEWSYTRFLLPALPVMPVLVALRAVDRGAAHRAVARRSAAAAVVCVVVAALSVYSAVSLGGVRHARRGAEISPRRRLRQRAAAGDRVRARRAAQRQHHGTTRGGRPCAGTCSTPASLDRAIASLRRAGYEPFVVLDVEEDEQLPRALRRTRSAGGRRADPDGDARQHQRLRLQMSARRLRIRIVRSSVNRDACA